MTEKPPAAPNEVSHAAPARHHPQTDNHYNTVRRINVATGVVTTLAGSAGVSGSTDAVGTSATFNGLRGLTLDAAGVFALIVSFDRAAGIGTLRSELTLSARRLTTRMAGSVASTWRLGGSQPSAVQRQFLPLLLQWMRRALLLSLYGENIRCVSMHELPVDAPLPAPPPPPTSDRHNRQFYSASRYIVGGFLVGRRLCIRW